ncbi:hypothetical protein [Nitrosophilus kaiyonis]|uniref:hypothetical protein n=1 Tax=Nitrosophilus kaiyonis TaxID=2930200 RepID=UPI00248FDBC9|nr:hypothetical protein [Nitrosophilus kaiyonis]
MAITQKITDIPTPPSSSDKANFRQRADNFLASLDNLADELNTFADQANLLEDDVNNWLGNKDEAYIRMYLGAKDTDPTTRNDGSALLTGDLYFNTTNNAMRVYTGNGWATISNFQNGGSVDGDIEFATTTEGIVLKDRTSTDADGNPLRYRLFVENGNLGIEEI